MAEPILRVPAIQVRSGNAAAGDRAVPNEVAIALTYGGSTQAVMMATPADLEDFAIGFSITEGLIDSPADLRSLELIEEDEGIELRMWLNPERAETYSRRRRLLAGPTGCGLCGIESLTEAVKPVAHVARQHVFTPEDVVAAMSALPDLQVLNAEARAVHAAGFFVPGSGFLAVREDVGRHNALDKLAGFLARTGHSVADGFVVLTSRVSVEMVQKTAVIGAPLIAAVSAPTALAIRTAEAAGITLSALVRGSDFQVFSHPAGIGLATD